MALMFALVLIGCEQAEITQAPIMVTPKSPAGAVGIDVYARDRATANPVPRFRAGQSLLEI